jgi:protein required for attachment to host cells
VANIEWVLVADSAYARVFERRRGELHLVETLQHPESREQNHDLVGNRPYLNQHSMEKGLKGEEPAALRDAESDLFAKILGRMLETAHAQNRFHSLVIVSDPRFLGTLRGELSKPVAACVSRSINKHAVQMKPAQVQELIAGQH